MDRHIGRDCCEDLFTEFKFQDLRNAFPPNKKAVYVIRVKKEGSSVTKIVEQVKQLVKDINWKLVEKYILNRIGRLEKINQCPIIYIGSAGIYRDSRNTLKGRYKEFSMRHTAMYPIWALLYFGWELELGWEEKDDPGNVESQLKQKYTERHNNKLPALVKQ